MSKRKREDDGIAENGASVRLEYSNLPNESRQRLIDLLHEWKVWHSDRFPPDYRPPAAESGALRFAPGGALAALPPSALPVLDDRPAPPAVPPTRTVWFNVQYEKVGDVPEYERALDRPLGGAGRGGRRGARARPPQVQAGPEAVDQDMNEEEEEDGEVVPFPGAEGEEEGGAAATAPAAATPATAQRPAKRMRAGQRCFNCGSYSHALRECWKAYDAAAVEAARRDFRDVASASAARRDAPKRYFLEAKEDGDGAEGEDKGSRAPESLAEEFPEAAPGQLSAKLRAALGVGPLAPPPWIHAMRALGVPPAYRAAGEAQEAAPAAAAPAPDVGLLPVLEDRGGGEAVAPENGNTTSDTSAEGEGDGVLDGDFIALLPEEAGADGAGAPASPPREEVAFPGVNAPIPEGADPAAWQERRRVHVRRPGQGPPRPLLGLHGRPQGQAEGPSAGYYGAPAEVQYYATPPPAAGPYGRAPQPLPAAPQQQGWEAAPGAVYGGAPPPQQQPYYRAYQQAHVPPQQAWAPPPPALQQPWHPPPPPHPQQPQQGSVQYDPAYAAHSYQVSPYQQPPPPQGAGYHGQGPPLPPGPPLDYGAQQAQQQQYNAYYSGPHDFYQQPQQYQQPAPPAALPGGGQGGWAPPPPRPPPPPPGP